jgi:hypothetical protein
MENAVALLERLAAGPKPFRVVSKLDNGEVRTMDCHSRRAADNHAASLRRKIGKPLIQRDTGLTVRYLSVEVFAA